MFYSVAPEWHLLNLYTFFEIKDRKLNLYTWFPKLTALSESKKGQLGCCISSWDASWRCTVAVASNSKASCKNCVSGDTSTLHWLTLPIRQGYSIFIHISSSFFFFSLSCIFGEGRGLLKIWELAQLFDKETEASLPYTSESGDQTAFWTELVLLEFPML